MTSVRAVVAIGSNIEPRHNVPEAVRALERHTGIEVLDCSRVYETRPVGGPDGQPDYHNMAVLVETALGAEALHGELHAIEEKLGRTRGADRFAPRTIDLDIAIYDCEHGVPDGTDPLISQHLYLARPIADVVPDWVEPVTGLPMRDVVLRLAHEEPDVERTSTQLVPLQTAGRYAVELEALPDEVYAPRYEALVRQQLVEMGEDPEREGLKRTPLRVAKAMDFLTSGYATTLEDVINEAVFEEPFEEMVLVKDVEFYSLCEHHLLPFFGRAHVGYLPNGRIIGLSKIARIVDLYARRLQVQERLANQVADALMDVLQPHGVAVVMEGSHFCMMMRGVQKQNSSMVTSAMRGTFTENASTRSEFLELIKD